MRLHSFVAQPKQLRCTVSNVTMMESKKRVQHLRFPSGPPPQYSTGPKLFIFANRTGCGACSLVWPYPTTMLLYCFFYKCSAKKNCVH